MIDRKEEFVDVGPFDEASKIRNPFEPLLATSTFCTPGKGESNPTQNDENDVDLNEEHQAMPTKQIPSNEDSAPMSTMLIGSPSSAATSSATASSDVLSAVEELVYEIKENLRLKARPSTVHSSRAARPSPYHIPCRSWSDSATTCDKQQLLNRHQHTHSHNHQQRKANTTAGSSMMGDPLGGRPDYDDRQDDPYEMLQTLLKSNNLVKEAVRRLQLNYDAMGGNDESASSSPKQQRFFYDSDDEQAVRSPMIRMCQLEL